MVDFVGSASEGYPTSPSIKVHQMSIANKINKKFRLMDFDDSQ